MEGDMATKRLPRAMMIPECGDPPAVDGLPKGRCTGKIPPFEMLAPKLPFEQQKNAVDKLVFLQF